MNEGEDQGLNAEKCQDLVEKFVEITATDSACAQFYLQDRKWNLERSVSDFFEANTSTREDTTTEPEVSNAGQKLLESLGPAYQLTSVPPPTFTFASWNLDGLQSRNLKMRTKAVCKILFEEKIDIVFLQELVPQTIEYIEDRLPEYQVISGRMDEEDYFTAILLLCYTVQYESHKIIQHPGSLMGRNLLCAKACIGDTKLALINSHLESTKDHAAERVQQFRNGLKCLLSTSPHRTGIFAGDFNLRDSEVDTAGGLPCGVEDIWEACGSRPEVRYTWDTKRNGNAQELIAGGGNRGFWPRMRFDRAYIKYSLMREVVPQHFGLLGLQKVAGTQSFPSDHWGIRVWFDNRRSQTKSASKADTTLEFDAETSGGPCTKKPRIKVEEVDFDAVD
ncbi:tyrosyl-DNA phosphodiesterase 2-like isoform X1 [Ischnura elegans]|uniref:tyrosyl-DNA phosphodiesterase 2-like isoform X1 n=1 Tax=Ischnura elegans TaxID=197161 RepID=UPI001ED8992D|nr:tyrosyl-DNA phosphodiesterase 2-like isoform X1 [Ischnura elegans]